MRAFPCLAALLSLVAFASAGEHTTDSLATIRANVTSGKALLVDVREPSEWNSGHIKGAVPLPLSDLQNGLSKADREALSKEKVLYTHCVSGRRSVVAAELLRKSGYTVKAMQPGYRELLKAGFPQAK